MVATFKLLRPRQWIKNAFVVAPIIFAPKFDSAEAWAFTLTATLAFILISACVYVLNDIRDREEDRLHPVKRARPVASGALGVPYALAVAMLCALACAALLTRLPVACSYVVAAYVLLNLLYTALLKKLALLDVFFIAVCFVLRVLAGCLAISVVMSPWIALTTFLLALFLGFGKRYNELGIAEYATIKPNLQHYSRELLDRLIVICAASALVCYAIYAAEMARTLNDNTIIYTVAFVAFGLFRYLQSIYVYAQGGEPERVILNDRWQWVNMALWLSVTMLALFGYA